MFTGCLFTPKAKKKKKKKDKGQVLQRNKMLSLYCTALGFISKNEEYNHE